VIKNCYKSKSNAANTNKKKKKKKKNERKKEANKKWSDIFHFYE